MSHSDPLALSDTPATPGTRSAGLPVQRVLGTLVQREFWEHRALWLVPLIVAALLVLSALPGTAVNLHPDARDWSLGLSQAQRVAIFALLQWGLAVPLYLTMGIVVSVYLLDSLYAERKDRSILFWKSLPVSDGLTVLSKLLVGVLIVPLGVFLLALVTHLLFCGLWEVRVALGGAKSVFAWDTAAWLRLEFAMLLAVLLGALWYAPIAALLLLTSAWVKRSPILWLTLATVLAPLLERMILGTRFLSALIGYRLVGIWGTLGLRDGTALHLRTLNEDTQIPSIPGLLQDLHFGRAFTDIDLWLGLAATAAMLYAAMRIRRYRDDT